MKFENYQKDKTIPTRRERMHREESRSTDAQIREALRAGNASKVVQEADRG